MYFEEVRQNLLREAKASPNLLSDLAGLEKYISESYHNRSFIELLQNADDAKASKFKIIKDGELLFVANNGRVFDQKDFESLCRSASSNKLKGETIGYRGIGFKSVVGFSKEIHVLSGDLEITYSKSQTQLEIPEATRVPLIRIPHLLSSKNKELISPTLKHLKSEGYTTIFIFTEIAVNAIESEFESFEYNSLIFLRNVTETEICLKEKVVTKINKRQILESKLYLTFETDNNITHWFISNENNSSIAFSIKDRQIVKLPQEESFIHAFLPTEDLSGLGVLINGNFNTDPTRRHLIIDEETIDSIKTCGQHVIELLIDNLKSNTQGSVEIVRALIPYSDPRMFQFMKNSFSKTLLEYIKNAEISFFKGIILCPNWLNRKDFLLLASNANGHLLNSNFYDIEGFNSFAKYLGATEIDFHVLKGNINNSDVSLLGCVQLTVYIFKSLLSNNKIKESDFSNLKIFYCHGKRRSLKELISDAAPLEESFTNLLRENGLTTFDINQSLKRFAPNIKIESQNYTSTTYIDTDEIPEKSVIDWFNKSKETINDPIKASISRWRTAEEQTLGILNLYGFKLEDVSKQNIGYDLEGLDPNGDEIQIEVKSITLPGQKFKLTNNEIAVAQEKQETFYIALVRQSETTFEIALIPDPVNNLVFNRQCVQWIWECEHYEYKPMSFEI